MLQIRAQTGRKITAARKTLANQLFAAAGFDEGQYAPAEQIDLSRDWALANMAILQAILPKYVLGDLSGLSGPRHRRCMMGFIRRMAAFLEGSVHCKRVQFKRNGMNTTSYMYKIMF